MKRSPTATRVFFAILSTSLGLAVFGDVGAARGAAPPPRNNDELAFRLRQLRDEYGPYLRSLPEPLEVRTRQTLAGPWRSKFEVTRAKDATRPEVPDWYGEEFDDSGWEPTEVPEWRYDIVKKKVPGSCILWYRTRFEAPPVESGKRVFLVFEGVDWEAEVYLNGQKLGTHQVYYEPFRFDVTELLKPQNTLAVRVIDGPVYGEPVAYWALFPVPPAKDARYVRNRSRSIGGFRNADTHVGSGFGIHREVYLETTGDATVSEIFARGYPEEKRAVVQVETDAQQKEELSLAVEIMPENFEGRAYQAELPYQVPKGQGTATVRVPMSEAQLWTPETPHLYRCRVTLKHGDKVVDAKDALFGYRSFTMASKEKPHGDLPPGMFLLNGAAVFLRGTNVQGLNALWYWGEEQKILDVLLMLKAANYNAVRSCQHVQYPEVRELQDRLGIMSQQDQGARYPRIGKQTRPALIVAATALARHCYNNPGVVLLSYANETRFDPTAMVAATVKVDPERIIKPISGHPHGAPAYPNPNKGRSGYKKLPKDLWVNVIDDLHTYSGWYRYGGEIWRLCQPLAADRMVTVGEYGGEALDGYETMARNYASHWKPTPSKGTDTLWGQVQTRKHDGRQIVGFRGRKPQNLGQYIEASQTYQADVLSEVTKGWRLSPRRIAGYFQFHFIDVVPANWPKSIVSHDLRPKKAYFEMAQVNQPIAVLPRLLDPPTAMELWVANDLSHKLEGCRVAWKIGHEGKTLVEGQQPVEVPAYDATMVAKVDLSALPDEAKVIDVSLVLLDAAGKELSSYRRALFIEAWRVKKQVWERLRAKAPASKESSQ